MKTTNYNPSPIEVAFAKAIAELREEIQQKTDGFRITDIVNNSQIDNPHLRLTLLDSDGDKHELLIQFIQRADQ